MADTTHRYFCDQCDYRSTRMYNLTRHIVLKHEQTINRVVPPSVTVLPTTVTVNPSSVMVVPKSVTPIVNNKQCVKCNKVFAKRCTMVKHSEKCKGIINKSECQYCHKIFSCNQGTCNHVRICPIKKQTDAAIQQNSNTPDVAQNNVNIFVFKQGDSDILDYIPKTHIRKIVSIDDITYTIITIGKEVLLHM